MVVDGDGDFLELSSSCLTLAGYDAYATDAVDALASLRSVHPDMVVTEWTLPMIDGYRFLKWMREEAGYSGPVLVLTALKRPEVENRALSVGADSILFKPAGPTRVLRQIADLLH